MGIEVFHEMHSMLKSQQIMVTLQNAIITSVCKWLSISETSETKCSAFYSDILSYANCCSLIQIFLQFVPSMDIANEEALENMVVFYMISQELVW